MTIVSDEDAEENVNENHSPIPKDDWERFNYT